MKKKLFAEGMSLKKIFIIFVIGSFFGAAYEELLVVVKQILNGLPIMWEYHRGVIYGPFNPLYWLGMVCFIYFIGKKNLSNFKTFLYSSLLGGFIEYVICFLQEVFLGTVSWDYSNHFLNINGRTTIPFMAIWGLFGLILIKLIYPKLSKIIEQIPINFGNLLVKCLIIFLSLDMLISWTALFRQTQRSEGKKPMTFIGELYDDIYPDEFLAKYFSNMKRIEE